MSKADLLFLNNKAMEAMGVLDMRAVMKDAERFANLVRERFPAVTPIPTMDIEAASRASDIIDCVTLASEPFIKGEWLKKGALVMDMADYEVADAFWEGIVPGFSGESRGFSLETH